MIKNMKTSWGCLVVLGASASLLSAHAVDRKPSSACRFDIKSLVVRSESSVDDYDKASDKLIKVYPELGSFSDPIPNSVSVKVQYETSGCREPLTVRVSEFPLVGKSIRPDDANYEALASTARQGAKFTAKPWEQRKASLVKLANSGEILVPGVRVLKYFESFSPKKTQVWSVKFQVSVLEADQEVAFKEIALDVSPQD